MSEVTKLIGRRARFALRGAAVLVVVMTVVVVIGLGVEGRDEANRMGSAQVGRQVDGSVVVTTNQVLTPAGRQVEFRGRPLSVVLSPDGRTAAFLNGTYQAIILVDVATWTVKQEFTTAGGSASFTGIAYSADGRQLYASQASGRVIVADVTAAGALVLNRYITSLPPSPIPYPGREDGDPLPGGLALSEDQSTLYVVLSRNNSVAAVDLASSRVTAEIPVGNAPHGILVAGNLAYVTNQGGRRARASDFTNDSSGTPIVASRRSGHAITGTGLRRRSAAGSRDQVDRRRTASDSDGARRSPPVRREQQQRHRLGHRRRRVSRRAHDCRESVSRRDLRLLAERTCD